jgi:PilZ domain
MMLEPSQERRRMRRFDMRLPAAVKVDEAGIDELFTETQNVSARGVFLYLDRPLADGSRIHVTLTFPPHITLTDPVRVRFTARVVRAEAPLPASRVGIAAIIEEYEFLRSAASSS